MKPKLKVLYVLNNNTWKSIDYKIRQVEEFFFPKIDLVSTVTRTTFKNIPFEEVKTIDGTGNQDGVDHEGTTETVNGSWFDKNISGPLGTGYDIIVFFIQNSDKAGHVTASGIRGDRSNGPIECIIFGGEEEYRLYVNNVDIGNSWVMFTAHEISHAIYMILAKKDNTHLYFYSGRPQKVLEDFDFPIPNTAEYQKSYIRQLIEKALSLAYQLLGQLQGKQKQAEYIVSEPVTASPVKTPAPEQPKKIDKVDLFCKAIESREGSIPPKTIFENGVDKYPKGTPAWRNNNPGNVKYVGQKSAIGKDASGFAIFPSKEVGYQYLYNLVLNTCKGLSAVRGPNYTIYEFFAGTADKNYQNGYAPSEDMNDPISYAVEVAVKVGVPATTKMKDLI